MVDDAECIPSVRLMNVCKVGKEVLEYSYGIKCDTKDKKHPENTTFSVFTIRPVK
jgi:hypothetical protein